MQYEWFQDDNQIIIRFEIKNTRLSNINVEIADLVVKVNVLDKKFVKTVDLYAPVTEGSVKYGNNILEVQLNKQTPQKWQQLKPDLTKEEIIQRRQESFRRKEGELLKQKQQKEDLKIQFDKHATQEQMRIDDNQRKEIDSIKLKQKQEAEEQIYQKMDQKANFVQADKQAYESDEEEEQEVQEKNIIENKVENNNNKVQTKEQNNKNEIFTEKDLKAQKERQQKPIPEPRKAAQVQIPFTEKVYPHLAAREQHFRDAPLPRQAKLTQKDYEDRQNPLFLKDKGDELFRNKDFYSAINAYSLAYKLDQNLIICLSNRSACHLNLFNYEECFNDCQTVIEYYQNKQIDDHILQKCLQRKQICLAWKGNLDECNLENYQDIINQRKQSNQYKNQGDSFLKVSQYDQAKQMYHKGLEYDKENEGCLSNLGLLYLKTHDYANAIQYIDQCIHKVEPFVQHVNLNPQIEQSNKKGFDLLIKNYLRKSTSYLQLNQEDDALDAIKSALKIEPLNDEARTIFNKIQARQQKQQAIKLKESATQKLKDKQYQEALHQYNQCLQQITPQEDLIDFLAVLLNKCICLYFLEQFDEILGACTRGIKLIQSQKNKVLAFQAISKEDQQKLDDYLIRFLCRRSNAHLKQSQLYHAISDLEEAIKLDPQNEALKKDLNKIKPV